MLLVHELLFGLCATEDLCNLTAALWLPIRLPVRLFHKEISQIDLVFLQAVHNRISNRPILVVVHLSLSLDVLPL